MNSPVNGLGNVTAADLVSRAAPSPVAHGGFEAVISDRGVDVAAATARARIETPPVVKAVPESNPVQSPVPIHDTTNASQATAPANGTSISSVPGQSTEAGSLAEVAGTYNARGRLASPTQEAPRSRLLDVIG